MSEKNEPQVPIVKILSPDEMLWNKIVETTERQIADTKSQIHDLPEILKFQEAVLKMAQDKLSSITGKKK